MKKTRLRLRVFPDQKQRKEQGELLSQETEMAVSASRSPLVRQDEQLVASIGAVSDAVIRQALWSSQGLGTLG